MKEIQIGDILKVTCPNHKDYTGKEMWCIGITKHGFYQCAFDKDSPVSDIYLGKLQVENVK